MALSFRHRIEAEGVTLNNEDFTYLDDFLMDAAEQVILSLPDGALEESAADFTDSGSGVDISTKRVVRAHKAGYRAIEIPTDQLVHYQTGGTYTPVAETPIYYRSSGKVYILPSGGTVRAVSFPTLTSGDQAVTGWPRAFHRLVSLRAALKFKERDLFNLRDELPALLSAGTLPTAPAAPSFSYSLATAATISAVTIGALPTAPTYSAPTAPTVTLTTIALLPTNPTFSSATSPTAGGTTIPTLPTAPTYPALSVQPSAVTVPTLNAFTLSGFLTLPTAPSVPSIAYASATAATIAEVSIPVMPTAPTYGALGPSLSFSSFTTYWNDEDPEMAQLALQQLRVQVEEYVQSITDRWNSYQERAELFRARMQRQIRNAELDLEERRAEADWSTNISAQNAARKLEQAVALQRARLERYETQLSGFRAGVEKDIAAFSTGLRLELDLYSLRRQADNSLFQARLGEQQQQFQAALTTWAKEVDRQTEQATLDQQRLLQDAQAALQANVTNARGTFEATSLRYQTGSQRTLERARIDAARRLTDAQAETKTRLDNAAQGLQASVVFHQSGLQRLLQQAQVTLQRLSEQARLATTVAQQNSIQTTQASIQQYASSLQRYGARIGSYSAEIERRSAVFQAAMQRQRVKYSQVREELNRLTQKYEQEKLLYIQTRRSSVPISIRYNEF